MELIILVLIIVIVILIIEKIRILKKYKMLRVVVNSIGDIISFKDKEGRIIEASNTFLELFYLDETAIGKTDNELIKSGSLKALEIENCIKSDKLTKEKKKKITIDERFKIENGEEKVFRVEKTPIYNKYNEFQGIVIVGKDITDKLKVEQLEKYAKAREQNIMELKQYNKIKTEIFANLSHEFRTPINIILSAIKMKEIYSSEGINISKENIKKQIEYTKVIKQNTLRLIRLINNIIDTTKYEFGNLECNLENGNIVEFIEDITTSLNSIMEERELTLTFDTNTEECFMAFDFSKMERIILNIISNSVKFTECGGQIFVTVEEFSKYLNIYIEDTGCGIPMDKIEFIFERFFQVDKSIKRNREGSGIGLNIVKSFVNIHDGDIEVLKSSDYGTCFKISLPKTLVENDNIEKKIDGNNNVERINIEFSDIYD